MKSEITMKRLYLRLLPMIILSIMLSQNAVMGQAARTSSSQSMGNTSSQSMGSTSSQSMGSTSSQSMGSTSSQGTSSTSSQSTSSTSSQSMGNTSSQNMGSTSSQSMGSTSSQSTRVPADESSSEPEIVVFFVNGISNSGKKAERSRDQLKDKIEEFDNKSFVELLYNKSKGFLKDASLPDMASAVAKIVADYWTDFSKNNCNEMKRKIMDKSKSFNEKTIVVFVCHSEGNLFVQRLLEDDEVVEVLSPYQPKVISVASPIAHRWAQVRHIINSHDFLYSSFCTSAGNNFGNSLVDNMLASNAVFSGDIAGMWVSEQIGRPKIAQREQWEKENVIVTKNNPELGPLDVHGFENYVVLNEFRDALEWAGFEKRRDVREEIIKIFGVYHNSWEMLRLEENRRGWMPYDEHIEFVEKRISKVFSEIDKVFDKNEKLNIYSCPKDFQESFKEFWDCEKKHKIAIIKYFKTPASYRENEELAKKFGDEYRRNIQKMWVIASLHYAEGSDCLELNGRCADMRYEIPYRWSLGHFDNSKLGIFDDIDWEDLQKKVEEKRVKKVKKSNIFVPYISVP